MWRTFNCGIGYTVIVGKNDADATIANLRDVNLTATQIGEVVKESGAERVRIA
jgi:phosphoribosylformylglycinamidine cyclo-ligase